MKLRIITDQEYVTVPLEELHLIQKVLDASSLMVLALSRFKIEDELVNHYMDNVIQRSSELNEYLEQKYKPKLKEELVKVEVVETPEIEPTIEPSSNVVSLFPKK